MTMTLTSQQRRDLLQHTWANFERAQRDVTTNGSTAVDAGGSWQLFDRLPSCTFTQPVEWRRRFCFTFARLAHDLENGRLPRPRTTAEQLALRMVIEDAACSGPAGETRHRTGAAGVRRGDGAWAAVTGALMNIHAVAAFYDPMLLRAWLGFFPIDTWFTPDPLTEPH